MPFKDINKAREYNKNRYRKLSKECPWVISYRCAMARCRNKKLTGYKYYGGKGITFIMSRDDFKFLWFRDLAFLMNCPSIDRIDSNGNYELNNCRYIERNINSLQASKNRKKKTHCINGHEFTYKNTYINKLNIKCCRLCSMDSYRRHILKYGRNW